MKLEFFTDSNDDLYKIDRETKKAYIWNDRGERWEALYEHVYYDFVEPDAIAKVRNAYRKLKKISEKEAFIEIL